MKDLYEAIECLSAKLSFRLEHWAKKKGYPVHYTGYNVQSQSGTRVRVYHTLVHLPNGYFANFQPREAPEPDNQSWHIAIRRSDGLVRQSFVNGLMVRPFEQSYGLFYGEEQLNADHIELLLEDLQKAGPSGLHNAISRLWTIRFGHMPVSVVSQIESLSNVDHLDLIYDALQDDRSRKQIDELLAHEPPLSAGPRPLRYLPRE
jgi:hypothetical protein